MLDTPELLHQVVVFGLVLLLDPTILLVQSFLRLPTLVRILPLALLPEHFVLLQDLLVLGLVVHHYHRDIFLQSPHLLEPLS